MKKVIALVLCICLMLSMSIVGSAASAKVQLKISAWGIETDPNSVIIKDAVKQFNEKNTSNATATIEFTEQEQYKTKIAALMAGNEAPDIFNTWAGGFLKPFVKAGKVYSLSDDLNKDAAWKNNYVSGILTPLSFDGKVYAAPTTQTVVCLFYNKEIFAKYNLKAPNTYDDLKKIIATLNKNKITPFALGNKAPWVGAMMSELVVNRVGGSAPFNKVFAGTGSWEDPSFIKAGNTMAELVKLNAFPKGFNALDNDPAQALFTSGKAAMLVMGSWAIQQLTNDKSPLKGKVDVCKFPTMAGTGSADTWLGQPDQSFAVSSACKNKAAAVEFIKFIASTNIQTQFGEAGNLIATKTKIDAAKGNPVALKVGELQKSMKELFLFYDVALGATIGNEYNNTIQAITAGKAPADQFKKLQQFTVKNRDK